MHFPFHWKYENFLRKVWILQNSKIYVPFKYSLQKKHKKQKTFFFKFWFFFFPSVMLEEAKKRWQWKKIKMAFLFFLIYFQNKKFLFLFTGIIYVCRIPSNYWANLFINVSYNISFTHWLCVLQINYRELYIFMGFAEGIYFFIICHITVSQTFCITHTFN